MFCAKSRQFMEHELDLLLKYLRGDATLNERLRVMEWVKEDDAHRKELDTLRRIYETLLVSDMGEHRASAGRTAVRKIFLGIGSALAAAAVAVGVFLMTGRQSQEADEMLKVSYVCAPAGYQTMTVLSDGTRIRLNSGSRLDVLTDNGNERHVRLKGEGYFDVARDEEKPFILETSGMRVKVLGTTFNVTAYDEVQSVVLVEGSVEAKGAGDSAAVVISPSERYVYDTVTGTGNVEAADVEEYTSWIDGYILLKETGVQEIFDRLENYFGVEIDCNADDFRDVTVSGKLMIDSGIETALETLSLMMPMKVDGLESGHVTISPVRRPAAGGTEIL